VSPPACRGRLVAVTQRADSLVERNERRDALDQRLCRWLIAAGHFPVPVPNAFDPRTLEIWLERVMPEALVLSGGNDLHEATDRDDTEHRLIDYARRRCLPALGICRGMQILATTEGATLARTRGHANARHSLNAANGLELPASVNSFHDWTLVACPADFQVLARAEDGSIEAIGHRILPWEGWMWHPEREVSFSALELRRVNALFA
jgi:N5-(cytidine 5'-diphosphoramidyl)-L-glutamine hydrolase